ncbi:MAG: amidohydrolase family protein [Novosphingobium sp.]|nr:amidohydrolase family protein [Novosphingobium sp.]
MSGLDLVIRNGLVIDGTGADGYVADIGIAGGRIAEIGKIAANGAQVIDAEGHAVTPGFIDGHTHMDAQVNWDPIGTNSCWHGVTTVVMGNCGFSVAPVRKGGQAMVARNLERAEDISGDAMNAGIDWTWETFDQYLDTVDALPKGINYSAYIGHSALRTWAMGERAFSEDASEDDLATMKAEIGRALDAGALGFSTSRSSSHETSDDRPVASRIASRDEVAQLVGSMKGRKGAMFELAHELRMPGSPEGNEYYGWLRDLTVSSGVTTTFGVLGPVAPLQFREIDATRAAGGKMIAQTHSRGVNSVLSFMSTLPFDQLPVWQEFRQQPLEAQLAGLRDPAMRDKLEDAAKNAVYGKAIGAEARAPDWDQFYVYDTPLPPYRSVGELSRERGVHPVTVVIDEALARQLDLFFFQPFTGQADEDLVKTLRHPASVMTFSDAGAHVSQIADASIHSHLIAYFCRKTGLLSLPEAVNMITRRGAEAWGFTDRGVLREGAIADINVFDPETFGPELPKVAYDLPTGARRLTQRSTGMKATIVSGEVLISEGEHTGALPGKLIRRSDS